MQAYTARTLELLSRPTDFFALPDVFPRTIKMTWTPTATRADVIRMVAWWVRTEYSLRSGAGRLVIDETRLPHKPRRRFTNDSEFMEWFANATPVEVYDTLRRADMERAVYAKPYDPTFDLQVINIEGDRPYRVAPLEAVARIVRPKARLGVNVDAGADTRNRRATIAQKLGHIPREEAETVVLAARLKIEIEELTNKADYIRKILQRLRSGGRSTKNLRRAGDERLSELQSKRSRKAEERTLLIRSDAYRDGIDGLLVVCTASEEVERECFGVTE